MPPSLLAPARLGPQKVEKETLMDFDKLEQQAQLLRDDCQRRLDIISRDQTLSPEGKLARGWRRWCAASAQRLEQLRAQALNEAAAERRRLEEAVWANPTGDTAASGHQARVDGLADDGSLKAGEMYRRACFVRRPWDAESGLALPRWGRAAGDDVPAEWQQAAEALGDHDASYGVGEVPDEPRHDLFPAGAVRAGGHELFTSSTAWPPPRRAEVAGPQAEGFRHQVAQRSVVGSAAQG